ncbi:MAG: HYR domain-containing protein [Verrucomicrobia bacterium]|nr:HYR domain-containing protein [Verrucomicrobiota bacterium]
MQGFPVLSVKGVEYVWTWPSERLPWGATRSKPPERQAPDITCLGMRCSSNTPLAVIAMVVFLGMMPIVGRGQSGLCVTLACPADLSVECQAPEGTAAGFEVAASTTCGTTIVVTCVPASGSLFPLGETTVTCAAVDDLGNSNSCSFNVMVRDTTAPQLQCPGIVLMPCETAEGTRIVFTATATDNDETDLEVQCDPPSGTLFPVGTNTVDCFTMDSSHNSGVCTFQVVVTGGCVEDECLEIVCPSNMVTQCSGSGGARVTYRIESTNHCGRIPVAGCVPPSGSVFPVGLTTVICTASDGDANAVHCTFTVEVLDKAAPEITCPENLELAAQGMDGAIVAWSVEAADDGGSDVAVRCDPPSGSLLPLGVTRVRCMATDPSGNRSSCGFSVTVVPRPFELELAVDSSVRLRWFGSGVPQETSTLESSMEWKAVAGSIHTNGDERTLSCPLGGGTRFFRLVGEPLAPAPDADGDGVPDARDRCAGTLAGLPVDDCGCALLQMARHPGQVAGPAMDKLHSLLESVHAYSGVVTVTVDAVKVNREGMEEALGWIRAGNISTAGTPDGVDRFQQAVEGLHAAHDDLLQTIAILQREYEAHPPDTGDYGDVTPEQTEIISCQVVARRLQAALEEAERATEALTTLRSSITGHESVSGTIEEINDAEGWIGLQDGRWIGLLETHYEGALVPGAQVEVGLWEMEGGYGLADTLDVVESGAPFPSNILKAICLHLRIAPNQPYPPFSPGFYVLHHPAAYSHSGTLWLEEGVRLAVVGGGCERISGGESIVRYRAKLDLTYTTRYGLNRTVTLATGLRPADTPVPLPADMRFGVPAVLAMHILRYECPPTEGQCSQTEVVAVLSYNLIVRARYSYAAAIYNRTVFDLEDSPAETSAREARVVSISRTAGVLYQVEQLGFLGEGYSFLLDEQTSFPNLLPIGLDQRFAIYATDLWDSDQILFPTGQLGVTNGAGIYWPRVIGQHNGCTFWYGCALPLVVRDAVSLCGNAPHTFYRLPFQGGWPVWIMSQANFGTWSHHGKSTYAFDFNAPQGTVIHAARGGIVTHVEECFSLNGKVEPPNHLHIKHQDGTVAWYLHMPMNGVLVSEGQRVYRGDAVALVGHTGWSTTPHLHLEVRDSTDWSIPIRFEARGVCWNVIPIPCDPNQACYIPETGNILFSTNKRWQD